MQQTNSKNIQIGKCGKYKNNTENTENTKIQKIPILPSNFHLKTESLPNFNKVNHLIKVGVTRAII